MNIKIIMGERRLSLLFAAMTFAVVGCGGGGDNFKLVPVKGTIKVGGSEPFANGTVVFVPPDGAKYLGGTGVTDAQGNFVIRHIKGKPGIEAGQYTVIFSLYKKPDGTALPDQSKEREQVSPMELGGVQFVPPDYSGLKSTKYPTTVSAAGGSFDFNIPELKPPAKKMASR